MVLLNINQINQWERKFALPLILNLSALRLRAGMLLLSCLLAGCHQQIATNSAPAQLSAVTSPQLKQSTETIPESVIAPSVVGLVTSLEDDVRDLPDSQIAWTTYWKLCWEPWAGAHEYELEPITGEGTGRRRIHQTGVCYRVEVAKGQNATAQGFFNRELMLASISGQMSYRVRAVFGNGHVSQWSTPAIVGHSGKLDSTSPARTK